jgi:hypothetical protein
MMPSQRRNPHLGAGANQCGVASMGSRGFNKGIGASVVREAVMAYQTLCKQRYLGEGETPTGCWLAEYPLRMADGMVEIDLAT